MYECRALNNKGNKNKSYQNMNVNVDVWDVTRLDRNQEWIYKSNKHSRKNEGDRSRYLGHDEGINNGEIVKKIDEIRVTINQDQRINRYRLLEKIWRHVV